jgi:membrane fusion protein (multidrug efflux system)
VSQRFNRRHVGARPVLIAAGNLWLAAAVVWLGGCHGGGGARGGFPPAQVGVETVQRVTVEEAFAFPGAVEPYRRVQVRARVDGIIQSRPFSEGSIVRPGQLLYQLDDVRYDAAYRSAQARFDNAKRTLDRLQPLLAQHAVAQQDVDNARFDYEASQAALDAARKDLSDTRVVAEIGGRVGRTQLDVGARVTGPADLLTTIDRVDPVYVSFEPSSQQLLEWRQNPRWRALIEPGSRLRVQVVLPDSTVLPRTGRLDFVAPVLDSATGTLQFRAVFANPDQLLVPGEFVTVQLLGFARDSAIAVPQRAVLTALGRQFVYVVGPGDVASVRDVTVGPWSGNLWVIERGLKSGDRVIVDGVQKVMPGRPVKPVPLADSAAAPAGPGGPAAAAPPAGRPGAKGGASR